MAADTCGTGTRPVSTSAWSSVHARRRVASRLKRRRSVLDDHADRDRRQGWAGYRSRVMSVNFLFVVFYLIVWFCLLGFWDIRWFEDGGWNQNWDFFVVLKTLKNVDTIVFYSHWFLLKKSVPLSQHPQREKRGAAVIWRKATWNPSFFLKFCIFRFYSPELSHNSAAFCRQKERLIVWRMDKT